MAENEGRPRAGDGQIVFIYPLVYRPEKDNFASEFKLLSQWYQGHIFALSGGKQRNVAISRFMFHSEGYPRSAIARFFKGLWIQVVIPFRLLWSKSPVLAVVSYDPYRSGVAALILKVLLRSKVIVQLNGDFHQTEPSGNPGVRRLMNRVFSSVMRRADAIKVLNADQEAFCRTSFPRSNVFRFPAFVATEYFQSLETYQGNYLLSIGHPFDLKGMDVLIGAFKRIADKHPKFDLRIMGYCPPDDLARYRELAGNSERIEFVNPGWIEDVGEQIRGCYALVNAARSEAMGRVHVEAMACGKPIVATRTSGGQECVADEETGLLCAIGDVEELADKLDTILSDASLAERMGRAGKVRMEMYYAERAYSNQFRSMIQQLLEHKTRMA